MDNEEKELGDLLPLKKRAMDIPSMRFYIRQQRSDTELYFDDDDTDGRKVDKKDSVKELRELKQLNTETEFKRKHMEDQKSLLKYQRKLHLVTQQRNILDRELLHYKEKVSQLEKTNKELETTLSQQGEGQRQKIHVLEMEAEKRKKEYNVLKDAELLVKSLKEELITKDNALYAKDKKIFQLTVKLEGLTKEKEARLALVPKSVVINITGDEADEYVEFAEHQTHRDSKLKLLVDKDRLLKKKESIIAEKEKQVEELKESLSKQVVPKVDPVANDELPLCKWRIRKLIEKVKILKAEVGMYKQQAGDYKIENEMLIDRKDTIKKYYLKEKQMHMDLLEDLKKNGVKIQKSGGKIHVKCEGLQNQLVTQLLPTVSTEQQDSTELASESGTKSVQPEALGSSRKAVLRPKVTTVTPSFSNIRTKASTSSTTLLPQLDDKPHQTTTTKKTTCYDRVKASTLARRAALQPPDNARQTTAIQVRTPLLTRRAALREEQKQHQTITITGEPCAVKARPPTNQVVLMGKPNRPLTPKTTTRPKHVHLPPIPSKSQLVSQDVKTPETKVFMTETD